jgi:hypothetical protein
MGVISKKLTEEELKSIRDIKQEYTNLALALGELELQKLGAHETYKQLVEKENKIAEQLRGKYGDGTIDLSTGEIKA